MTSGTSTSRNRRKSGTSSTHKRLKSRVDIGVLDCKICFDPLTLPVYECENGHPVCNICRKKLQRKCPTCGLLADSRCRPLEEMIESVKVKCKNWDYGCKELLNYCNRDDHEKNCIYAQYLCDQPACNFREARHEEIRVRLLQEVSFLVAQSADLSRVNHELSEKLSRMEDELSARVSSLVTQNDDLRRINLGLTDELASLKRVVGLGGYF